eukprot:SAG22_NODE_294_length_12872_cov_47.391372_3_plen_1542_part_00
MLQGAELEGAPEPAPEEPAPETSAAEGAPAELAPEEPAPETSAAEGAPAEPAPEEPAPETSAADESVAPYMFLWVFRESEGGNWLPLPQRMSVLLSKYSPKTLDDVHFEGVQAAAAFAHEIRVPILEARSIAAEMGADIAEFRYVVDWDNAQDKAGIGGSKIGEYVTGLDIDEQLATTLCDMCIRNGVFASMSDVSNLAYRLASLNIVCTTNLCRPGGQTAKKTDAVETLVGFCSWCKRTTMHQLQIKRVGRRDTFVCQSCQNMSKICEACTKSALCPPGMACERSFDDANCYVHTYLKPPPHGAAMPDDAVPLALLNNPVSCCPWCGVQCAQLLSEANHAPRRSAYKCSECSQRTLPCKGKVHVQAAVPHESAGAAGAALQMESLETTFDVPPAVIGDMQQLRNDLTTPVDTKGNVEHAELLAHLKESILGEPATDAAVGAAGAAVTPASSPWVSLGFQNEDPATDFRAVGLLGLMTMIFFADRAQATVIEMVNHGTTSAGQPAIERSTSAPSGRSFPFALASINISKMLADILEIDCPVHDSPWLERVMNLITEDARGQSVAVVFLELHNAVLAKLFMMWCGRNATVVAFGELLAECSTNLKQFLSAPGPTLEALSTWATQPLLKANATGEWGASFEGFEEQKYRLFHRFTNRTEYQLELIDDYTETGRFWEAAPPLIEPGATVTWGTCGKKGFVGMSTGTCGAVAYRGPTFLVVLAHSYPVVGADVAAGGLYAQLAMPSLRSHYDRVIGTKAQEENQLEKLLLSKGGIDWSRTGVPAPSTEQNRIEWTLESVEEDTDAILYQKWLQPCAALKLEPKFVILKFANKCKAAHAKLVFENIWWEVGEWWERPPASIDAGSTVAFGACGKKGLVLHSGTAGTALFRGPDFDVTISFSNPLVVGAQRAVGAIYGKEELPANANLQDVHTALIGSKETSVAAHGVKLSWELPTTGSRLGGSQTCWTLTDTEGGGGGGEHGGGTDGDGLDGGSSPTAFCRGYALWDDDLCFDCKGIGFDEQHLRSTAATPIFCSWCFATSPGFKLVRRNKTSRDEWECTQCGGECFRCQKPGGCENMARGGTANMAGFSRLRCDFCRLGKVECARIGIRMERADEHFAFLSENAAAMRNELTRDSKEFRSATACLMTRPFICLVAMGWRQRRSLCMQLGWALVESSNFGVPHAEALEIVEKPGSGILSRSNQSYEKLNPGASNADWDEVLTRTLAACFGICRHVKSSDVADPAGQLLRPIKEVLRQKAERRARLTDGGDPRVRTLEDEVLEKLWLSRAGLQTPEARDLMDQSLLSPEVHLLGQKLKQAGVTSDLAARYFLLSAQEAAAAAAAHQPVSAAAAEMASAEPASSAAERRSLFLSQTEAAVDTETETEADVLHKPVLHSTEIAAAIGKAQLGEDSLAAAVSPEQMVSAGTESKAAEQQGKEVVKEGMARTAGTRAAAVAMQASWQLPMRATGNALIAPVVGSAGAVALTSTMFGIGVALVVKDIVKIAIGSSEGRLLPVVRAVVLTRYTLALRGIILEDMCQLSDGGIE